MMQAFRKMVFRLERVKNFLAASENTTTISTSKSRTPSTLFLRITTLHGRLIGWTGARSACCWRVIPLIAPPAGSCYARRLP